MSSNLYPEPPRLSSAKELMAKINSVKDISSERTTEFNLPTAEDTRPQIDKTEQENLIDGNEGHPTPESAKNDTESEVNDSSSVSEEETASDTYSGGPWAIIKHTGYFTVAAWALLTAAATGAAGYFFTPGDYAWIALGLLGLMTGVIAAVDRKTHLIKDQHTILTAILTVPLSLFVAFNLGAWNFLFGIIAAIVVFGVFIFLIIKVNFGSGGDIKFSPVPAFALGVVNPLISALWLFYALVVTVVILVVRKQKRTSFGEGMAISLPLAIASVYGLYSMAGLPYM